MGRGGRRTALPQSSSGEVRGAEDSRLAKPSARRRAFIAWDGLRAGRHAGERGGGARMEGAGSGPPREAFDQLPSAYQCQVYAHECC